jgi:imidazolonepropionase-like amidohydrolase
MDVVVAATSGAAKAMGVADEVGIVKPGMAADLVYLDGDPLSDVRAFGRVLGVVLGGRLVADDRYVLDDGIAALPRDSAVLAPLAG